MQRENRTLNREIEGRERNVTVIFYRILGMAVIYGEETFLDYSFTADSNYFMAFSVEHSLERASTEMRSGFRQGPRKGLVIICFCIGAVQDGIRVVAVPEPC